MAELNEQQIDLISAYIRKHGVASDELHDDLLDHVCTSIENLMAEGQSFEDAFAKTIKLFGPGGLQQVQQQTFEFLTEMNETMKKVAFVFGLASAFLLLAGTIFKLLHLMGANVMYVLGAAMLTLGYLPMLLFHKLKEAPRSEYPLHIAGFVGMAITTVGAVFKIMHWPGAFMLLIGLLTFGLFYIPLYFYHRYKTSANKQVTLSASLVAMTCLIIVFALVNLNGNSARMDLALVLPGSHAFEASKAVTTNVFDGQDEFDEAASDLVAMIDQMTIDLVMRSESVSADRAAEIDLMSLASKYDFKTPTYYLFEESESPRIQDLIDAIDRSRDAYASAFGSTEPIDGLMAFSIDEEYPMRNETLDWAAYHFYGVPMSSVLAQLGQIKLDLQTADLLLAVNETSRPTASDPPSGGEG